MVETRSPNECWPWKGSFDRYGYPTFSYQGRKYRGNRVAYSLTKGDLGALHALHDCDNRACCNPDHLHAGDNAMNHREKVERNRQRHGDQKGTANSQSVINDDMVRLIREKLNSGISVRKTALELGIGRGIVSNISCGRAWRHVI